MIISHPFISLLLFAIVAIGAKAMHDSIVSLITKLFKSCSPKVVKHVAFTVVAASVMLMTVPLLIPFGGPVRAVVMVLYLVYAGSGLWQVWSFFYERGTRSRS